MFHRLTVHSLAPGLEISIDGLTGTNVGAGETNRTSATFHLLFGLAAYKAMK